MSTAAQTIFMLPSRVRRRNPARRTVLQDYGISVVEAKSGAVEASNA